MSDTSKTFDQTIHDAYEGIKLSDDAQNRMLANLLAAQAQQAETDVAASDDEGRVEAPVAAGTTDGGKVIPFARDRRRTAFWLSAAAAVMLAIVVGVRGIGQSSMQESAMNAASKESSESAWDSSDNAEESTTMLELEEDVALKEESVGAAEPMADGAAPVADLATQRVDLYPRVELADGTKLTALIEGLHVREVAPGDVGELVGEAQASPFDSDEQVACEVFRLVGEDGAYAVRYEGEDSFWYCTPF